jgi:murein DD-endopeptidase MepM/ murein hydrolase activator NlpD
MYMRDVKGGTRGASQPGEATAKATRYYHLRKGSVGVAVGQAVTCGQKIAQVGSSGYSSGPHLHFQTNTDPANISSGDDPFAASSPSCGGSTSWWVAQGGTPRDARVHLRERAATPSSAVRPHRRAVHLQL